MPPCRTPVTTVNTLPSAPLWHLLVAVVLPLWVLSGVADWACHRWQRIERTAGLGESLLHVAMLGQLGAAVVMAVLFEPSPVVLWTLFGLAVAHELTMAADIAFADHRRHIAALEQWVHCVQHGAPWVALALWTLSHWHVPVAPGFHVRGVPWPEAWAVVAAAGAVLGLLFVEEAVRAWRERRRGA